MSTMASAMKMDESITHQDSSLAKMIRSPVVPHLAFWLVGFLAKLLMPGTFQWLAYDSISTMLISVWYPLCATVSLIHRDEKSNKSDYGAIESLQMERQFWIEYWSVGFASVQFLYQSILLVPSLHQMGRYDYPRLPVVLSEIKLLFFAWIFVMPPLLGRYQQYLGEKKRKESWKKFVPLTILARTIGPRLMRVQMAISEQISRDTWHRLIQRKAQRVLELMVVFQFLEEQSMSYLLQLMDEGRSLLLLSVFAVMPSSLCQLGTLYAQLIFPSSRSLAARGNAMEVLSLKYWVLNSLLSLFLSGAWWILWFIPFSTQLILGIRCFATFPSTINHHYAHVEMELVTFGILKGEPKLKPRETKTVQALRAVVKRLPRDRQAQSFQFEIDESDSEGKGGDDDSSVGSQDTTESEEERRRQRRREKRAKKRALKQQQMAGSNRPPPLLSESFISKYVKDDENDSNGRQRNEFIDTDGNYSSFINTNSSCETLSSSEREQRDSRNASRNPSSIPKAGTRSGSSDNEDLTVGSSFSSSQLQSGKLTPVVVATPTETVVGEVEIQIRPSASTSERGTRTPLFPATHPKSYGMNLAMPSASSSYETTQTSNDEMDWSPNETNESFESWKPSNEESADSAMDEDQVIPAPRRSTRLSQKQQQEEDARLLQLREWQAKKRAEEEAKKKSKTSKSKPRPEGPREDDDKKAKKSSKKSKEESPKKTKKSKSPKKESKSTEEKKVKKKSAASPDKASKKSKKKGEAPLDPEGSSPPKKKKVPNSRKKKTKEPSTSVLGGILGRT